MDVIQPVVTVKTEFEYRDKNNVIIWDFRPSGFKCKKQDGP